MDKNIKQRTTRLITVIILNVMLLALVLYLIFFLNDNIGVGLLIFAGGGALAEQYFIITSLLKERKEYIEWAQKLDEELEEEENNKNDE